MAGRRNWANLGSIWDMMSILQARQSGGGRYASRFWTSQLDYSSHGWYSCISPVKLSRVSDVASLVRGEPWKRMDSMSTGTIDMSRCSLNFPRATKVSALVRPKPEETSYI